MMSKRLPGILLKGNDSKNMLDVVTHARIPNSGEKTYVEPSQQKYFLCRN